MLKIKTGHYYRCRDGSVAGPMIGQVGIRRDAPWPFVCAQQQEWYDENGKANLGATELDLVEELERPRFERPDEELADLWQIYVEAGPQRLRPSGLRFGDWYEKRKHTSIPRHLAALARRRAKLAKRLAQEERMRHEYALDPGRASGQI